MLALLLASVLAGAPPPELEALKSKLSRTSSIKANFVQKRHWAAFKDAMVTRGTFSYQKPGKLVWKTLPPAESELILDGDRAVMRYPRLKTEQVFDFSSDPGMAAIFDSILAMLQADADRLAPYYELAIKVREPLEIELKPRYAAVAKVVERIHLGFDPQLNLTSVVLREPGGDRTEIIFKDHQVAGPAK